MRMLEQASTYPTRQAPRWRMMWSDSSGMSLASSRREARAAPYVLRQRYPVVSPFSAVNIQVQIMSEIH